MTQGAIILAKATDGIPSRGDLTSSCWNRRVAGEDAIDRVIPRLRRLSQGLGNAGAQDS